MNKLIFEKEGFVLVDNIFSHEDVSNILNLIDNYTIKHKDKFEIHEINYTKSGLVNSIHCLHKYDSSIIDYVKKNKKFMNNINTLLDDEVEIVVAEAFLKPPGEGMPSPNHQDNNLWCLEKGDAFTCWIALDDIDEKNGGLKLWKKSHKVGALEHEESFKPGTSQTLREDEYKKIGGKNNYLVNKLKAGDIQFHHSLTVHGSDANLTDRSRRVLTVQVFSKKDSRCPILWKKYKDSLMKQKIENKGLTVSLIEKTISCEEAYQILDDPWSQIEKENSEKFNLITFFSNFLYNEKNCRKFLELGSGLGKVVETLKKSNQKIDIIGSDISITCVNNAKKMYKDLNFIKLDICHENDRQELLKINPDVLIFADITWYILNNLNEIKDYLLTNFKGKYIIHILNMYPDPKYGIEYFKNHQELLKFFNFNFIYEGNIWYNNGQNSYFLAQI